jgi:DNA processing protein
LSASERAAYLFMALLQARVGMSLLPRLGEIPPSGLLEVSPSELSRRMRMGEKASRALEELRRDFDPGARLERPSERGISVLTPVDAGYPERLEETPDPPPALFVRGEIPEGAAVALVGSRKASARGIEAARKLGRALGEREVCVVSGLALGVDSAADEGALEVGGPVVGVLGCGIDVLQQKRQAWRK